MSYLTMIIRMIPVIFKLMSIAEKAFDGIPDSSQEKFNMVVTAIKELIKGISGFTLDDATWAKIEGVLEPLINLACTVLFPKDDEVEG